MTLKRTLLAVGMVSIIMVAGVTPNVSAAQDVTCNNEHSRAEQFEGFDEFDSAVEEAIDSGVLKTTPEMRQPSSVEIVARRMVGYVFMKYLTISESLGNGYETVKQWLWSVLARVYTTDSAKAQR